MNEYGMSFINGLSRSKESEILPDETIMRMADAETEADAYKIATERGFGGNSSYDDYEQLLNAERVKLFDFIKKYSPDYEYIAYFLVKNDFFNTEIALRRKYLKIRESISIDGGQYSPSDIESFIEKGNLPEHLKKPYLLGEELFKSGKATGKDISMIFLNAYYAYLKKTVKSPVLKDLVAYDIDCKNIFTAMRTDVANLCDGDLLPYGKIKKEVLSLISACNESKVLDALFGGDYYELMKVVFKEKDSGKFIKSEKILRNYPITHTENIKYEVKGAIPFLMYCLKKLDEINKVCIVLYCKKAGLTPSEIKERL